MPALLRSLSIVCFVLVLSRVVAQTPIAQVRDLTIGTTVTIQGVVLNGNEFGSTRYVQDATAGIAVYPGTGSVSGFGPARGSLVTITGVLKNYYGLLEMDPVTAFSVNSTGNALPAAQIITVTQMDETRESEQVRINGCTFPGGGNFTSGTNAITSNGQNGLVYLRTGHPMVGTAKPSGSVDLVGVVSQYSTSTPASGGYQLMLRNAADIIVSTTIAMVGEVQQTNILPAGFTLTWNTNIAGTSQVSYGLTPALGSSAQTAGTSAAHSVVLSGLAPATSYYAQCWSVNGVDTARSAVGLYSTASSVAGDITVYFTRPTDPSVATGPLAITLGDAIDDTVAAYIGRAQSTIDYAVYNTTVTGIVDVLNAAHANGRTVRVIAEASNSNSALANLSSGIGLIYRTDGLGSGMHDKFIAMDADIPAKAVTITGSTNSTYQSYFTDANNMVVVRDQAVTRAYRTEFNEMYGSAGAQPNTGNSRFGADKTDNTPHWFNVGGIPVQSWFSPSDGTTGRIVDALHTADQRVEFALYAFTSSTLADALIELRTSGRSVRGMIDDMDPTYWLVQDMLAAGIDVRSDNDNTRLLHHKYAIVDGDVTASDPLVITGSHNWSYNAEDINDENTLVIHSALVANLFRQEWNARWNMALGVSEHTIDLAELRAWPNPVTDRLELQFTLDARSATRIVVLDASGRVVLEQAINQRNGQVRTSIDVAALADGHYTARIVGADVSGSVRFVHTR